MQWTDSLSTPEINFIKEFILVSGSLKAISKKYEVSYPTVRVRLDKIIKKIESIDESNNTPFKTKLMQLVIDDEINLHEANEILRIYQESENNG